MTSQLESSELPEQDPPLPMLPTNAPAGSSEKVEVLAERVASNRHLWHPEDSKEMSTKNVGFKN
jgi:hypothetical protein